MGKYIDRVQHIADCRRLDEGLNSAKGWLTTWRSSGRWVMLHGNDVIVENWHSLPDHQKTILAELQPHLAAAIAIETASA